MISISQIHTKACFKAWMSCEDLLNDIAHVRHIFSKKMLNVLDECAFICLGTFNALKAGHADVKKMALLCVGICEECAEICEAQRGEVFLQCARICRECSDRMAGFSLS